MEIQDLQNKTVAELKSIASDLEISGVSKLPKQKLIDIIIENSISKKFKCLDINFNYKFEITFHFTKTNCISECVPTLNEVFDFMIFNKITEKFLDFYFSDFLISKAISKISNEKNVNNMLTLKFDTTEKDEILNRLIHKNIDKMVIYFNDECLNLGVITISNIVYEK